MMEKNSKLLLSCFYSIDPIFFLSLSSENNFFQKSFEQDINLTFSRSSKNKILFFEDLEKNILFFVTLQKIKENKNFNNLLEKIKLLKKILSFKGYKIFNLKVIDEKEFRDLIVLNNYIKIFLMSSRESPKQLEIKEKIIPLSLKALISLEKLFIER